jgi:hypothetical protein
MRESRAPTRRGVRVHPARRIATITRLRRRLQPVSRSPAKYRMRCSAPSRSSQQCLAGSSITIRQRPNAPADRILKDFEGGQSTADRLAGWRYFFVSAGLKRSHSRRYGMHHLTPEVTSAHTPTKAANRRSKSQECEFFPAETNHQFTGILPRRPFPQELRTLGVFVIRPGRLDDQVPRTRIVTLPTRRNMAWHRFEGQFAMSCSA